MKWKIIVTTIIVIFLTSIISLNQSIMLKNSAVLTKNSTLEMKQLSSNWFNNQPKPVATAAPTIQEIKDDYQHQFKKLEVDVNNKLDNLMDEAYNEYKQKKQNDEKISFSHFYTKYKDIAVQLENNTDKHFYKLYNQLQLELKSHGYNRNEAEQFKTIYEKSKSKQRNQMLKRFLQALG
ncbi:hypothetical protein [Aquibacillus saliphilus]|uniref:hypothetical protein n=1 Tax=Aquibacillus saliphilus TaxID=1909422 RepID=UPI001CF024C9|nr:hypothetical protein [Aquibacillus saliphilus]